MPHKLPDQVLKLAGSHQCRSIEAEETGEILSNGYHLQKLKCLECGEDLLIEKWLDRKEVIPDFDHYSWSSIFSLDQEVPPVKTFELLRLLETLRKQYYIIDALYPGLFSLSPVEELVSNKSCGMLLEADGHILIYRWKDSREEWYLEREVPDGS